MTSQADEHRKRNRLRSTAVLVLLKGVAALLVGLVWLVLLVASGFIIFVPVVAFLVWVVLQGKRRTLRLNWRLAAVLFVASVALSGLMGWSYFRSTRRPNTFLLQQGYVGWFRVRWSVPKAAGLPLKEGRFILKIPADGLLNTSTPCEKGWASDTFFTVDKSGHRTKLSLDEGNGKSVVVWGIFDRGQEQCYFLGTKQQFMSAGPDKNGGKPIGAS